MGAWAALESGLSISAYVFAMATMGLPSGLAIPSTASFAISRRKFASASALTGRALRRNLYTHPAYRKFGEFHQKNY
jgi:hypothetical protein